MDHKETQESLARLETKVDVLLDALPDHENRLRVLEVFRSRFLGALAVVAAVGGLIAAKFQAVKELL